MSVCGGRDSSAEKGRSIVRVCERRAIMQKLENSSWDRRSKNRFDEKLISWCNLAISSFPWSIFGLESICMTNFNLSPCNSHLHEKSRTFFTPASAPTGAQTYIILYHRRGTTCALLAVLIKVAELTSICEASNHQQIELTCDQIFRTTPSGYIIAFYANESRQLLYWHLALFCQSS